MEAGAPPPLLLPRGALKESRPILKQPTITFLNARKMAEEQATTPVEEEPMTQVEEVEDDSAAINELDEMFKERFSENDSDFMAVMNKEDIPPPVISNFLDLKYARYVFNSSFIRINCNA